MFFIISIFTSIFPEFFWIRKLKIVNIYCFFTLCGAVLSIYTQQYQMYLPQTVSGVDVYQLSYLLLLLADQWILLVTCSAHTICSISPEVSVGQGRFYPVMYPESKFSGAGCSSDPVLFTFPWLESVVTSIWLDMGQKNINAPLLGMGATCHPLASHFCVKGREGTPPPELLL